MLAERGVGRLVVTGAQTDACIRSTLHGAFVRGYDATLVGDAHTTEDLTAYGAPHAGPGHRPHQPVLGLPDGARPHRRHRRRPPRSASRSVDYSLAQQHVRVGPDLPVRTTTNAASASS